MVGEGEPYRSIGKKHSSNNGANGRGRNFLECDHTSKRRSTSNKVSSSNRGVYGRGSGNQVVPRYSSGKEFEKMNRHGYGKCLPTQIFFVRSIF